MKKQHSFAILFFLAAIPFLFLPSCSSDSLEDLQGSIDSCAHDTISFTSKVMPMLQTNCGASAGSCHGSSSSRQYFIDYTTVKAKIDDGRIEDRALIQKDMPPSSPMSDCDQDLLRKWIDNGALDN